MDAAQYTFDGASCCELAACVSRVKCDNLSLCAWLLSYLCMPARHACLFVAACSPAAQVASWQHVRSVCMEGIGLLHVLRLRVHAVAGGTWPPVANYAQALLSPLFVGWRRMLGSTYRLSCAVNAGLGAAAVCAAHVLRARCDPGPSRSAGGLTSWNSPPGGYDVVYRLDVLRVCWNYVAASLRHSTYASCGRPFWGLNASCPVAVRPFIFRSEPRRA
jgi:hypothetical protein